MKARLITILYFNFFILLPQIVYGQPNCSPINEDDYYSFYNNQINSDSIKIYILSNKPITDNILKDTVKIFADSMFTKNDIAFMRFQIENSKMFNWTNGKITGATVVQENRLRKIFNYNNYKHRSITYNGWKKFRRKYGNKGIARYSIPIFSCDKKYCIINKSWSCGSLCGEGGTDLYQKIDGRWVWLKWYSLYIS